jgi:6-phosphogluconolactonase (cycloisomerase 2 family)
VKRTFLIALIGVFALFGAAALTGTASAKSDAVGHVYVNNNTAGRNSISAFDRHADGSLTPLADSPYATGGRGTGSTLASQGALQLSADGRYLLAVDAGSNTISVLRIHNDGSLQLADTVPSGGNLPLSIAVHDDLVYVANGGAGANYTGFNLNAGGHLRPIAGSTVTLSGPAAPVDILFNKTGTLLAATKFGPGDSPSQIDTFAVSKSGLLTAAPGAPFTAQGAAPFGSAFRPTNPSQLFVSNAHNGTDLGTVSAFSVAADGTLSSISGSPFRDFQTAPCWVEISPDGYTLFAVNTAVPSITTFSIAPNGTLSNPVSVGFNEPTGLRPFDIRIDPTGHFVYVVGAGKVSAFYFNGATLNEIAGSPMPLAWNANASGIVVN